MLPGLTAHVTHGTESALSQSELLADITVTLANRGLFAAEWLYVQVDGAVYEAIPNEGSFTLWLPMETDITGAQAYIFQ